MTYAQAEPQPGTDAATEPEGNPMSLMPPEMANAPQPFLKALRDECPVMPIEDAVVLFSRAAVDEAFRDPVRFSSNMDAVDLQNVRPLIPLQIDPPDHKKFRKLLDPIFAPKQMVRLEEPITKLANELIDGLMARDEINFGPDFSIPFPSQVFLTLLGLPLDQLPRLLTLKDGIIRPDHVTGEKYGSEAAVDYQRGVALSTYDYFNEILDLREVQREDDLLSHFLDAEVEGEKLTRDEILDICFLFLIAGLDTVTATLDCMFAYLAQHPEKRAEIVADPSIIPAAVEELLRWETPVMTVVRVATVDTEIGGCPVKQGDGVMPMLASANTDDGDDADLGEVRFDREENRHLAFGGGIHRCLGSHLARQELRIALREWHRRIPDYEVKPGVELSYTGGIRSIDDFPLLISPIRD